MASHHHLPAWAESPDGSPGSLGSPRPTLTRGRVGKPAASLRSLGSVGKPAASLRSLGSAVRRLAFGETSSTPSRPRTRSNKQAWGAQVQASPGQPVSTARFEAATDGEYLELLRRADYAGAVEYALGKCADDEGASPQTKAVAAHMHKLWTLPVPNVGLPLQQIAGQAFRDSGVPAPSDAVTAAFGGGAPPKAKKSAAKSAAKPALEPPRKARR